MTDDGVKTVALLFMKNVGRLPAVAEAFFALDPKRYRKLCIFLKRGPESASTDWVRACPVHYISGLAAFPVFNVFAVWKLARLLRREKVDILHCQRHQATVYGAVAGRLAGTKAVLSHVHGLNRSRSFRRRLTNLLVLRWVRRIIAVSEASRQDVLACNRGLGQQKVICLNNSVDTRQFARAPVSREEMRRSMGLKPGTMAFVAVGRLAPTKGLTYLLHAFADVKKQAVHCELFLVGEGPSRRDLEVLAETLGLHDAVHFLGFRNDVAAILCGMDVFVMASVAEGMPGALLEAMASGLPCIATAVGGIPQVLENGRLGVLAPARDSAALAAAMSGVAANIEDYQEMTAEARRAVLCRYDHSAVGARLAEIYDAISESA